MVGFISELKINIRRRFTDGFLLGYNIIFPILIIALLGVLCRNISYGKINSYKYYTIVSIPFCIVMALITAAYAGKDDAYAKTAERVLLCPISIKTIVISKIISSMISIFLCGIIVYIGGSLIFNIDFKDIGYIGLLLFLLSFCVSALGTYIGLGMKNFLVVKNFISIPISVFAILGGSFFAFGSSNKIIQFFINCSPFTWINRSIFLVLYDKNYDLITSLYLILAGAGILFTALAIVTFKKEEYMDGSLLGYEE